MKSLLVQTRSIKTIEKRIKRKMHIMFGKLEKKVKKNGKWRNWVIESAPDTIDHMGKKGKTKSIWTNFVPHANW